MAYDDSGVSDITSSSGQSAGHVTSHVTELDSTSDEASSSEKWALVRISLITSHTASPLTPHPPPFTSHPSQASKYCADAKDYLEMMCRDLSGELSHFDLQKEMELKQILMEYASRQLERHEKVRELWEKGEGEGERERGRGRGEGERERERGRE